MIVIPVVLLGGGIGRTAAFLQLLIRPKVPKHGVLLSLIANIQVVHF
jgi:hypothetical protein